MHHANYFERCSNSHFWHCAHCVYQIYSVLKLFEIPVCFAHFWLFRNFYSGDAPHANYGERCSNHHFPHCAHCVYQIYSVLKSSEIAVCFANFAFYKISTPVMPTTLSVANIAYIIISNIAHIVCITFQGFWSFLKWVLFAHFGFDEISTPVMRTMLTMVNVVQIIISDFSHTVYIRFKAFWNFSKLLFVLHILAFTKFLLRWCAQC